LECENTGLAGVCQTGR